MRPPALARLLARATASREDRAFVLADLDERYRERSEALGASAARRWYWSQVLRGVVWRVSPDAELMRRRSWEGAAGDARLAARTLMRRPVYTVGVVGTLALGLASAALVWTVAWGVWLAPMPFPEPDRVVRVFETEPIEMSVAGEEVGRGWRVSPPLLEDMRAAEWSTLEAVGGVSPDQFDWQQGDRVRRLSVLKASPEVLSILGVTPIGGRLLAEDGVPEVLLTEAFWVREFGGDPNAIGASLVLDGNPHAVVGVVRMPPGYPEATDVVRTLVWDPTQLAPGMRGARYLDVIARARVGRSVEDVANELTAFVRALGETEPQHRGWGGNAAVLGDELLRPYRGILALLLAAGLTFLALAVVNVGGLVAARRAEARGDRAVRLALGASEGRLVRASVVESVLLGGVGASIALLATYWLFGPLRALVPQDVPRLAHVSVGPGLAAVVMVAGLGVGALVGVLGYAMSRGGPAVRARRTVSAPGLRGRQYLVAGQVALTTLLTTGGVAILAHVWQLRGVDVGFHPEGVVSSATVLSEVRYDGDEDELRFWRAIDDGLRARGIPAAIAINTPMSGMNAPYGFRVDDASEQAFAQYHSVSDGYFEIMGVDVLAGRGFGEEDHAASAPALIVSEAFEREHYPDGAVGRELRLLNTPRTIVGVVASTRHFGPDAEIPLEVYVPMEQDPWHSATVLLRTERGDAAAALAGVVDQADPFQEFPPLEPYTRHMDEWYAPLRLQLVMVGGLALLGLMLASLGLYALVAYHVSTRRREIGIRMALGAPVERVFRQVLAHGLWLGALGGAVGLGVWYALLPRARELLDGIDAAGALLPVMVAAIVGVACVVATLVPAWRSTTVDPVTTLRAE